MPKGLVRSKKQQDADDLTQAARLKPKLRKFLIDTQVNAAAKAIHDTDSQVEKLSAMESQMKEVVNRAKVLSHVAFMDKKLWLAYPPAVAMRWLTTASVSPDLEKEQLLDTWAFAKYLVMEFFRNYLEHKDDKAGYPNPLAEENIAWFWQKFNADIRLLIEADQRRVDAGNDPVILVTPEKKEENAAN
jgi:hypothetical protein